MESRDDTDIQYLPAGYTFSLLFGSIYDSSTPSTSPKSALAGNTKLPAAIEKLLRRAGDAVGHLHICPLGRECYVGVFLYTIPACMFALLVSVILSLRRGRGRERHEALLLDEEEFLAEVER